MFELADATAKLGLLKQQYFGRAPKAAVIRCCHSVSKMLQIDGGRANTTKFSIGFMFTDHTCPELKCVRLKVEYDQNLKQLRLLGG
jgi:hypothetical protein